jgi:pimeloyl-ACP methyl ester carboxylesterase
MRGVTFLLTLVVGAALAPAPAAATEPIADEAECPEIFFDGLGSVDCYTVVVPERHETPGRGRPIQLFVSILRSTANDPLPDPVVYLAGGPGSTAAEVASLFAESTLRSTRDLVLVEQRGTALADPFLGCPALDVNESLYAADPADDETFEEVIGTSAAECAAAYEADGIDLAAYSTAQNAADIEAIRLALGIDSWNLYGVSYGTRLGFEILRRYPDAVRSAVFDSVYAPGTEAYRDRTPQLASALTAAVEACDADAACAARFGSLGDLFERAVARWQASPGEVYAPYTADSQSRVVVDEGAVAGVVYSSLVTDFTRLPLSLEALASGRTELLELTYLGSGLNAEGMRLSVECAETLARLDPSAQAASDAAHPELASAFRRFPEAVACRQWPVRSADPELSEPVVSDVPVLLISGALDPITPPSGAKHAAETLSNARLHLVPFGGHGAGVTDPCAVEVRDAFIAEPSGSVLPACEAPGSPFVTGVTPHAGATRAWIEIWLRSKPWARAPLEPILGGIGAVCALILFVGAWRLLRHGRSATWLLGMTTSLLLLTFAALLAVVWIPPESASVAIYGLPAWLAWIPWLGLVALVACAAFAVAVTGSWLRRIGSWRERLFLSVGLAAAGLGLWLLGSYGLIGIG